MQGYAKATTFPGTTLPVCECISSSTSPSYLPILPYPTFPYYTHTLPYPSLPRYDRIVHHQIKMETDDTSLWLNYDRKGWLTKQVCVCVCVCCMLYHTSHHPYHCYK